LLSEKFAVNLDGLWGHMKIWQTEKTTGLLALIVALSLVSGSAKAEQQQPAADEDGSSVQSPGVITDPDVQTIEGVLEQNIPEGAPKVDLPIRPQKTPGTIDFSQLKDDKALHDTVVIQKTYMPKTSRVSLFGGASLSMNDVFYRTYGLDARAGYYFNETWGLELNTFYLTSSDTHEKTDLAGQQSLDVQSLSTPKSLYAANVYFSSIYGKMALEDRRIIPFEFYQTLGLGQITTNPSSTSTAFYFGLGNLFSISKNSVIRADLSWYFYNSKTITGASQAVNTIFFTIGYGRFVPEAVRR
jgi:outer membrane beta-barrel protein